MTAAQDKLHWRLWAQIRRARPGVDRKGVYAELGLPESHVVWENKHLDDWIAHAAAVSRPGDYVAQVRQVKQPEVRRRFTVEPLLGALEVGEEYVNGIVKRQCQGRWVTWQQLPEGALKNVLIALKMECRRRWGTKGALLAEIRRLCADFEVDEGAAREAAEGALGGPLTGGLEGLSYDALLPVLGALKALAGRAQSGRATARCEEELVEVEGDPF